MASIAKMNVTLTIDARPFRRSMARLQKYLDEKEEETNGESFFKFERAGNISILKFNILGFRCVRERVGIVVVWEIRRPHPIRWIRQSLAGKIL